MASNDVEDNSTENLSDKFDEALRIVNSVSNSVEATNSDSVQLEVKRGIRLLEEATRMVSTIGLFSENESIDEVATSDIKYLLLPAFLGTLVMKLCNQNRLEVIEVADVYLRDFLKRCNNYGVTNIKIPKALNSEEADEQSHASVQSSTSSLEHGAYVRSAKIKQLQERKELEEQLKMLELQVDKHSADDEVKRNYYLTLIKTYANTAIEDLNSLAIEKPLAEYSAKMQSEREKPKKRPPPPLKAIIITRTEVQKKVFGAGYPSLPVMTVEEFYEKKIRDGEWSDKNSVALSLQDMSNLENKDQRDEEEAAKKEELQEKDDPEELKRRRDFDEYKDDHRRGYGNRYNRS